MIFNCGSYCLLTSTISFTIFRWRCFLPVWGPSCLLSSPGCRFACSGTLSLTTVILFVLNRWFRCVRGLWAASLGALFTFIVIGVVWSVRDFCLIMTLSGAFSLNHVSGRICCCLIVSFLQQVRRRVIRRISLVAGRPCCRCYNATRVFNDPILNVW